VTATTTAGALYRRTCNLWASFAIHLFVDFMPYLLLPLLGVLGARREPIPR
jgi:membrane protease YdiL (CAAX protease family)